MIVISQIRMISTPNGPVVDMLNACGMAAFSLAPDEHHRGVARSIRRCGIVPCQNSLPDHPAAGAGLIFWAPRSDVLGGEMTRMYREYCRLAPGVVWLLAVVVLSACSPGGLYSGDMMWAPHRSVVVTEETTNEAKRALAEGDRAGTITLTETEFTSLLHLFLLGDQDLNDLVRRISVWFEDDRVYLQALLKQGVIPGISTDVALNLEATMDVEDGQLKMGVKRMGLGVLPVLSTPLIQLLENALDTQIREFGAGQFPSDIRLETGTFSIDVP